MRDQQAGRTVLRGTRPSPEGPCLGATPFAECGVWAPPGSRGDRTPWPVSAPPVFLSPHSGKFLPMGRACLASKSLAGDPARPWVSAPGGWGVGAAWLCGGPSPVFPEPLCSPVLAQEAAGLLPPPGVQTPHLCPESSHPPRPVPAHPGLGPQPLSPGLPGRVPDPPGERSHGVTSPQGPGTEPAQKGRSRAKKGGV